MTISDYIAVSALIISVLSFATSMYFGLLDRVRIKAVSKLYNMDPEFGPSFLEVKAINCGRRVTILTTFGAKLDDGSCVSTYIGKDGQGIRLAENEYHVEKLKMSDLKQVDPSTGDIREYEELYFEDSLGRRHTVRHSRQDIARLKATSK
jgi:hypothetical protein